jgi:hypothetical protein
VTGRLTGAAATGGEGSWRRRESFSATSSRHSAGESSESPGTGGALRSGRGRRARPRARERGRCCLGRFWGWWESFQGRMAALYRREREHRRCPVAASTPCVLAVGGARHGSGVGGGLRCIAEALWRACGLRGGLVQRGQVMAVRRGLGWFLSFSSRSHGCGLGRGGWARHSECTRHGYRTWGEREQHRPQ